MLCGRPPYLHRVAQGQVLRHGHRITLSTAALRVKVSTQKCDSHGSYDVLSQQHNVILLWPHGGLTLQ